MVSFQSSQGGHYCVVSDNFARSLQTLADDGNLHIIAGSYHDRMANPPLRFNSSPVFVPHRQKLLQHKSHAATRLGERIDIPTDPRTWVVETANCNFAVVICLDATDLNLSASIHDRNVKVAEGLQPVHVIFCPSFSRSSTIFGEAETFAYAVQAHVALVNGCEDRGVGECRLIGPQRGTDPGVAYEDADLAVFNVPSLASGLRQVSVE